MDKVLVGVGFWDMLFGGLRFGSSRVLGVRMLWIWNLRFPIIL